MRNKLKFIDDDLDKCHWNSVASISTIVCLVCYSNSKKKLFNFFGAINNMVLLEKKYLLLPRSFVTTKSIESVWCGKWNIIPGTIHALLANYDFFVCVALFGKCQSQNDISTVDFWCPYRELCVLYTSAV